MARGAMLQRGPALRVAAVISVAAWGGACAGSSSSSSSEGTSESVGRDEKPIRPIERTMVGLAAPYPADRGLRARTSELDASKKARRAAAWEAVARALAPVAIAEQRLAMDAGCVDGGAADGGAAATLPTFRTWYGKDDFERAFAVAFSAMTPEDRAARRALRDNEIAAALAKNAASRGSASDSDYANRLALVVDGPALEGIGGNQRVAYSPGAVAHMMKSYAHTRDCRTPRTDDPEPSATSFAPCFGDEMPADAAVVKTSWSRANFGLEVPIYDTSAKALASRLRGDVDDGGWGAGNGEAAPGPSEIYTIRLSDRASFRLAGMHVMTKELREWLWITLWWSPEPDSDFGADRPEAIRRLGGPWSHYKMCVVTSYDEHDPDPRGGFEGSLGDALEAVHGGVGAPTWCSNPSIERGAHNAQTNCMGCHQHASTDSTSETILGNPARFPSGGRTRLRRSFLSDYLWALTSPPEQLAEIVRRQVGD